MFGKFKTLTQLNKHYGQRYGLPNEPLPEIVMGASKGFKGQLIIVIPAFAELSPWLPLQGLFASTEHIEVLVVFVFNYPQNATAQQKNDTQLGMQQLQQWLENTQPPAHFFIEILQLFNLSNKHGGVGLARKIGMDYALNVFANENINGLILTTDADCELSDRYLTEAKRAIESKAEVVHFNFKHLAAHQPHRHSLPIVYYELFLRYYVAGLRWAGYPYWYHTIGSCMGVRAANYALCGGMNQRKAGEDFYFLHKLYPHCLTYLSAHAVVFPSDREGNRVPFGTGRAMLDWKSGQQRHKFFYHPNSFKILKSLLGYFDQITDAEQQIPMGQDVLLIDKWLAQQGFFDRLKQLQNKQNVNKPIFHKHLLTWLDGFRVRKLVHYLRDNHFPDMPAQQAVANLLNPADLEKIDTGNSTIADLVALFYDYDRKSAGNLEKKP